MRDMQRIPDWLHGEMMNWSRWCWEGAYPHPLPASSCGSAESEYRAHGENATDDAKPIPANEDRAKIVDAVWRSLPPMQKMVVRTEYPGRRDHDWSFGRASVARKLKMRLGEYEEYLMRGLSKVWDAFDSRRGAL